jgi:hypothetical protein
MLDQHPELSANISLVSAMAPIAYNSHTQGMLRWTAQFLADIPNWASVSFPSKVVTLTYKMMQQCEFLAPSEGLNSIFSKYCQENSTTQTACYEFLFLVTGLVGKG